MDKTQIVANRVGAEELAALSHEFRTPLNGVLGMARLLEGTGLTGEQKTYVTALRDSGEHLLALVNDLLDFAKLGASKVELHPTRFEVEDLLRAVTELLAPRAQEKGLDIAWAAPEGIGAILADEGRLRQILLNFAGNAIKFARAGGVLISVSLEGPETLRFSIIDTGPGVPQADRARIFEAFTQSNPNYDGVQLGGAGLGLAIARTLADVMGGEVGVGDAPGGGAEFWFSGRFQRWEGLADSSLAGRIVGVVSDNPIVLEAAVRQIRACSGQALTAARPEDLDPAAQVLLIDHSLEPQGPPDKRPALILLPPEGRGRIDDYRGAGFAGYLIKPLRRASLAERVLAALGADPRRGAAVVEDERVAAAVAQGTRVLLVEDNAINALLARTLLTREGCLVDVAGGGQEALAALAVGAYDLVLMDMRMPDLSGVETTRRLRDGGDRTPIVALTANAFEDDRRACLEVGMNDFLVKPLAADALRRVLTQLVRGGWTEAPARAKLP
ncbi:MAG: hybrid sensor histidine kinase/response regulator [Alphaproteobacteria bacterium PA2]|nr:MAG: hybrid sensor histidine kinase/response regulator [Alphaproteobacteria bacterium PA2]